MKVMTVAFILDLRLFAFFIATVHFICIKLNVKHKTNYVAISLNFNSVNERYLFIAVSNERTNCFSSIILVHIQSLVKLGN